MTKYLGSPKNDDNEQGRGTGTVVVSRPQLRTKEPAMYKVLLHNDDFTPMDFVVEIIQSIFNRDRQKATQIMLDVHHKGVGVCGVYPYDVAETKATLVTDYAQENEYPLKCTLEKNE